MTGAHLLVVDDEPHVARVIQCACEQAGYRVSAARSLERARAILASEHGVDLIFLDVGLPDGSGLDLLQEIRHADGTRHVPVVILTGFAGDDVRTRAAGLGAQYVTKPFSPSKIERLVADVLGADARHP